jgi:ATP-dependent exoDNAse (exonuclease V) alpha subunit
MAIYRCETKILSRRVKDKSGKAVPNREHSAIESAAYRSCEKLKDRRQDKTFNYAPRAREVAHSEILAPESAPEWLRPAEAVTKPKLRSLRERLWNEVEARERRKDSQLCREFVLTMPIELTHEQNLELVRGWCEQEFVSKGYVADINLHRSRKGNNPHAHVLCTMRPMGSEGFGLKPDTNGKFNGRGSVGVGAKDELLHWRETWCQHENAALEKAGRPERVDHRSLKDRGLDRVPEPKIGVDAAAMQRKGKVADPDNIRRARQVMLENEVMPHIRDIQRKGEIPQHGNGASWWERSTIFVQKAAQNIQERAKQAWQRLVQRTEPRGGQPPPQPSGGRER